MMIRPKNWREFQHYKDRSPPWIRLHRKLLDDRDFHRLPVESRALAPMLWLLASETVDGRINGSHEELAFRLRCRESEIAKAIKPLLSSGFFVDASDEPLIDPDLTIAKANGFGSRHIPDHVKREVWERDGGKCCACESTESIEYDHKTPVSKGGTSDASNIQLLCRTCNRKKRVTPSEQLATPAQPRPGMRRSEAEAETEPEQRESETRARDVPRGTSDAGDALGRMPNAEDALAEMFEAWREVDGVDETAARSWFAHWSRVHAGRDMPAHQRIAAAKLLAGLGEADTQRRAVATAEANGWKALRHGDGRKPLADKGPDPAKRAEAELRGWADVEARAERIGFRKRGAGDDLIGYRTLVERAESLKPAQRNGPRSAAELLARTQ